MGGEPFFLKFGKFTDRAIESLMFEEAGYAELDRLAARADTPSSKAFNARVRRMLAIGEAPQLKAWCACGAPATHVSVKRHSDGVAFGAFCCASCARPTYPWTDAVELKFSSILRFHGTVDRRCFIRELKQACGFGTKELITAKKAHAFFYPEPVATLRFRASPEPTTPPVRPNPRGRELPFAK